MGWAEPGRCHATGISVGVDYVPVVDYPEVAPAIYDLTNLVVLIQTETDPARRQTLENAFDIRAASLVSRGLRPVMSHPAIKRHEAAMKEAMVDVRVLRNRGLDFTEGLGRHLAALVARTANEVNLRSPRDFEPPPFRYD